MKKTNLIMSILTFGLLFVMIVGWSQAQTLETPKANESIIDRQSVIGMDTIVARSIPIQGHLTDANGNPLDGDFNLTFRIYNVETGGGALCTQTNLVSVEEGLFNTSVDTCYSDAIHGQEVWLGIEVESDGEMVPRQPLLPVPYALTLRPGATIRGELSGLSMLTVENTDTLNVVSYGLTGKSNALGGRGVFGWANATTGSAFGLYGRSDSAGGAGVYARGLENGADLILHGDSASEDNGTIYSDPRYPSSDIVIRSNDVVRIDLDNDGDGEDADLEIYDKDDNLIFDIDESGSIKSSANSYIWISGNDLRKKNSDDLTKLSLDTFGGVEIYPGVPGVSARDVMLPVSIPGQLYGQNVTITGIDVYLRTTGSSYIDGTYIRRQSSAGSGDLIIVDGTNRSCTVACTYHLDLTTNNILDNQKGIIYIAFGLSFSGEPDYIQFGGVRLTLEHD